MMNRSLSRALKYNPANNPASMELHAQYTASIKLTYIKYGNFFLVTHTLGWYLRAHRKSSSAVAMALARGILVAAYITVPSV